MQAHLRADRGVGDARDTYGHRYALRGPRPEFIAFICSETPVPEH